MRPKSIHAKKKFCLKNAKIAANKSWLESVSETKLNAMPQKNTVIFAEWKAIKKKVYLSRWSSTDTKWKPTKYFTNCHEINFKNCQRIFDLVACWMAISPLKPSNAMLFPFLLTCANRRRTLRLASGEKSTNQAIFFPSSNCCVIFSRVFLFLQLRQMNLFFCSPKLCFFRLVPTKIDMLTVYSDLIAFCSLLFCEMIFSYDFVVVVRIL